MVTLRQLAIDTLGNVSIFISAPYGYSGSVFNEKETAYIEIEVKNNTGLTLRDVVVNIYAYGAVKIFPIEISWPIKIILFDGEESWDELKPYETKKFPVRLKGKYDGSGYLYAYISAEIVPFASRYRTSRTITVLPA